ncbi:MAG: helix-hairpin-helix domain-containing protein [Firmicutes bacterium]|nr:helix-hairpin-helix domain-containing protein [Bacillota bacterium]
MQGAESKTIIVHITGSVKVAGVISLKEGDRIIDAIDKAGGITEDADLSKVNLAYVLQDGQKVYIPSLQDDEIIKTVTDGSGDDVIADGESNNIVNINRATEAELETLSGIGPSTALKIIEYRKENGSFKKIEDLMNVPGIGQAKFDAIKSKITI